MAENLNYDVPGNTADVCYGNSADNCAKYGRLYNWSTAMNNAASSSSSPSGVQGACPVGWHIPSTAEWTTLTDFIGGALNRATELYSYSDWGRFVASNPYGFTALPGGIGYADGSFNYVSSQGYWWSATQSNEDNANVRLIQRDGTSVYSSTPNKSNLYSVRCVQD
jgi:uncharacterized protein (TIGR02145 family)